MCQHVLMSHGCGVQTAIIASMHTELPAHSSGVHQPRLASYAIAYDLANTRHCSHAVASCTTQMLRFNTPWLRTLGANLCCIVIVQPTHSAFLHF